MVRFYVSYIQDCGWAAMWCHSVIEAESLSDATENWQQYIRDQGYRCNPAYGEEPEELFELAGELADKSDDEVKEFLSGPPECSFHDPRRENKCSAPCNYGDQPRGCCEERWQAWQDKWGHLTGNKILGDKAMEYPFCERGDIHCLDQRCICIDEPRYRAKFKAAAVNKITQCPHDHLLVAGELTTCQKCDAIMKYVPNGSDKHWSPKACAEWANWFGPHWAQDRVVDWDATKIRLEISGYARPSQRSWRLFGWVILPIATWGIIWYAVDRLLG